MIVSFLVSWLNGGCVRSNNDTFSTDFVNDLDWQNCLHAGICVAMVGGCLSVCLSVCLYCTGRSKVLDT